ncbi:helix-turn-helix domain-containing protein [Bacillus toyonensis]|uniref:Transcriptional regulator n=1 Tax=Bacillus toyonensis TaxID=155322 RepID=A0A2A8HJD6_9BACI|nr:helix-turn-helix transcriptional regulator [Bacillus toyonensis]PEQ09145.1 transcriptional regulator [Bacillus toyonensis]
MGNKQKQFRVNVQTALVLQETTLTELAKQLGISVSYLSDIVRGNREGKKYKSKIAELLGFHYEEMKEVS